MPHANPTSYSICVFCGARNGTRGDYTDFAEQLGKELARQGVGLVYGGSERGLMGSLARATLDAGGHVIGIIPADLVEKEKAAGASTELYVVSNMHQRKSLMYRLAAGFVALPGGFGTMDELLEIATWAKLGLHSKPIALANVGGYFDPLVNWFDRAVQDGFVDPAERQLVRTLDTVDEVLDHLQPARIVGKPPQANWSVWKAGAGEHAIRRQAGSQV
ncbi:MAG TPA: TIGR00730 family Rossman fold protein [Pseudonocardiaceae bacterium]|nr:TIGR00730 family Rossman fold protein [Pseudonocardiaceae bacterium]